MTDTPISSPAPIKRTWMPTTAGILCVIAGAMQILSGLFISVLFGVLGSIFDRFTDLGTHPIICAIIGIPFVILGIVALVGGICSLQRKNWGIGLAGAICAVFPGSGLLGILSIIFVSLSKKEFV
jgi:hypothetical protein